MKIAVVRALSLGELLCSVPAFRALDAEYPAARIVLVGLPEAREFAVRFRRYIDGFVEFPEFPGLPEGECDLAAFPFFFEKMNAAGFDLALQMHGAGRFTNPLTALMGARHTAGFYQPGSYCPDPERFIDWDEDEHEVARCLRLIARLGIQSRGSHLEFPLAEPDWNEWRALRLDRYACVHAFPDPGSPGWSAERFAEIADMLAMDGWQIVLTGADADAPLSAAIAGAMREPALDLAGRVSLGGLGALIARARLLVSNGMSVTQIAAAMRTPSVTLSADEHSRRWAPLNGTLHRVLPPGVSVSDVLSEARRRSQARAA